MPIINFDPDRRKSLPAMREQLEFIDQLIIDCGMWDDRKKVIKSRFDKSYFDELSMYEAHILIEELKERKDGSRH